MGQEQQTIAAVPAVALEGVTKSYGAFTAVRDLSFALAPGSITGFVGQNGAGKTTTVRMMLGVIRPSAGRISVFGRPPGPAMLARTGYLPEERGLYKRMAAARAIAYFARLKGVPAPQAKARALQLLDRFGLGAQGRARIETLSKGMAQKVQLLATIVHDPDLLILDEPFSGLDPVNQHLLEDLIRELAERGKTILFSTHMMEHAERLCDRILMIARGRKVFEGGRQEARRLLPRRVRVAGTGDPSFLTAVRGVSAVTPDPEPGVLDVVLLPGADAQAVLAACFQNQYPLTRFEVHEPTLRDVFVSLAAKAEEEQA